jgi:DNA polymerase-3 subunit beta
MKIIIKKTIIENAIVRLQPFLERKDFSHITSHILFEVSEEDGFILKATDNELGLRIEITDFILDESGIATCNGKKILDTIRTLKDGDVIIETNEENNTMHIKQNRSNYKLPMFKADEFPVFPQFDNLLKINIDSLKIINSFKKIMPTIDHTNPKIELNGALIDIKENIINIVRTDTKRLGIIKIDNNSTDEIQIIIPKKAIGEMNKLFLGTTNIYFDQTKLILQSQNQLFFTKLINGKFPDYERIVPNEFTHKINIAKDSFISAIKQSNIFSDDISITFLNDRIIFKNINKEGFDAKTELELETGIENEFTITVNSRYVIDFLSQIDTKECLFCFNEQNRPFMLKSENFITIIMPSNI